MFPRRDSASCQPSQQTDNISAAESLDCVQRSYFSCHVCLDGEKNVFGEISFSVMATSCV